MRICLLGDTHGNIDEGMKNITYNLSKRLMKRHDVLVLNPLDFASASFWRQLREFKPDIIHYIPGPSLRSFILMKLISYFTKHSVKHRPRLVMSTPLPQLSKFSMQVISKIKAKPDVMLVQSKKHLEIFQKLGFNVHLFPLYGVDTEKFIPVDNKRKKELRARYGFNEDTFVLLHVGHIKSGRNILSLTSLEGRDSIHLVIVGSTSTDVEKKVYTELKKAGSTVITEYIPHIEELYQLSDCYIFPTMSKNNSIVVPLSVLEAMSCNLPVITTKFGALPEIFVSGDGLFFIEREEEIYKALETIREKGITVKTREKVLLYSWENIVKRLEDVYEELLHY
ncbi:glycosyltransferase [Thermococcus sp. 101 C5]|uniref:glycosyltransferase family 4 protein n=1 Tax=Thermococcus sp. 101 C5 TaxID=2654197 RepID=UPI00128D0CCB|nr:glycosyltransferase family 4 protein [Thermococcus sp. 101 C5]MPW38610.1 glycosyltransferase [Thermococcus sp. 101 C5]